ncbi:sodium/solute symporter [Victivallis vadensis]|uniref:SSS family solute:Na+ symporter n=1 Tax=Victivallis vadensis TaxID=172901 RepID=A0A2U1AV41_9BACT|nr:sodium/solute symporter [Victivallis vadensis]NMD85785.1 sodium/solute symporter [Victivallis vadensis]PVY40296.1 SSS family solute:Na+ symporter [Victivallis vadensis]PWM80799.1 MAG: sodium:solute symporter [Lentisphaerota bacterium]
MANLINLSVVALFLLGMAGMGVYFLKRNNSSEEYFLGGRKIPGWALGLSMVGTSISSITFLALPAAAFVLDYRQLTPNLFMPVAALIACWIFIPFFRRGLKTTAYEYLESRYGTGIRIYAALYSLLGQLLRLAIILYLVVLPLSEMLDISESTAILAFGVITCFYTVFGGIEAVVWTDVVQTVILLGGGLLCVAAVAFQLPGGLPQILEIGMEYDKFSLGPLDFSFSERTFWVMSLIGFIGFISEFSSNQNVVQRYIAAPTLREARKATLICIVMSLPTWIFFFFIGSCLFAYYKVFPSAEVAAMKPDDVLPHFILTEIWPGVGGVIIAACLAAAMSSLSSSINAVSTIWTIDFLRLMRRKGNDRFELVNAKLASGAAGIIMIAGAWGISLIPRESVYDLSAILGALLCSAGLTPFMLGFFTTRIGNRAILSGMYAALVFSVYNILNYFKLLPEPLQWNIHIYMAGPVCNGVMLAVALAYSLFRPEPVTEQLRGLTVWTLDSPGKAD